MASTPADRASGLPQPPDEPEQAPVDRPAGPGPDASLPDDAASSTATVPGADRDRAPSTAEPWHRPEPVSSAPVIRPTRISGTWIAVIVAAVVLIFLLVFILQNLTTVTVNFLGFSGSLPLGVAILFAAIAGAILIALVGTARILQLRRFARRQVFTRRTVR
jgi:uncharacterized integral membrane protein